VSDLESLNVGETWGWTWTWTFGRAPGRGAVVD